MGDSIGDIVDYAESYLESHGPEDSSIPGAPGEGKRDTSTAGDTSTAIPDALMVEDTQAASAALESTHPSATTDRAANARIIQLVPFRLESQLSVWASQLRQPKSI